ncbi:MAG: cytochrome c oxidase subunit 4 [Actinomycetota bacterium]|nr:cytochrome c oxidase subunit 4 [Actinomycetota bacterium]
MSLYARIALGLAVFLGVAGVVYAVASHEYVGTSLLLIATACFAFLGLYVRRAVRAAAAESRADSAEKAEEPHIAPTIWPFVFSLAAVGLALGAIVSRWLIPVGAALFVAAGVGWFLDVGRQWGHGRQR